MCMFRNVPLLNHSAITFKSLNPILCVLPLSAHGWNKHAFLSKNITNFRRDNISAADRAHCVTAVHMCAPVQLYVLSACGESTSEAAEEVNVQSGFTLEEQDYKMMHEKWTELLITHRLLASVGTLQINKECTDLEAYIQANASKLLAQGAHESPIMFSHS